jgi:hypothetical protein
VPHLNSLKWESSGGEGVWETKPFELRVMAPRFVITRFNNFILLYFLGQYGLGGSQYNSRGPMMVGSAQQQAEDEEAAAEDEEDMGVIETYSNYWPSKLKVEYTS